MAETCQIQAGLTDKEIEQVAPDGDVTLDKISEAIIEAKEKQLTALNQLKVIQSRLQDQMGHSKGQGAGLTAILTRDPTEMSGYVSLQGRINQVRGSAHVQLDKFMDTMRTKFRRNLAALAGGSVQTAEQKALGKDITRALYGESASAEAKAYAKSWSKTVDSLRNRLAQALGVRLSQLESWRLPQNHDRNAIAKAKFDEWFDYIDGRLDHHAMNISGKSFNERRELLQSIYNDITTDGAASLTGEGATQAVANNLLSRYNKQRVLQFKDATGWSSYQSRFGSQNIYKTMMDHVDKLSRDIAAAEHLGPNPTKTFNYLKTQVQKATGDMNAARRQESTFNLLVGKSTGQGGWVASALPSIRNFNVSTQLTGSLLMSFSDGPLGVLSSTYNAMPAFGQMKRYFKTIASSKDSRRMATRLMLSADYAIDRGLAAHDYTGNMGSVYSQNLAETAMKASLLSPHTEILRASFGVEFMSSLTQDSGKSFAMLSRARKDALKRYGITSEDWDIIRNAEQLSMHGENFIDPTKMPMDQQVKVISMVSQETDVAVPTPDARERTMLTMGTDAGSTIGELTRSVVQYKAHPLHMLMTQLNRGVIQPNVSGKIAYTSALVASLTLMGAISVQAKELSKGNTGFDWDSPTLWVNAVKAGGGLSLIGDLILNNGVSGYGQSLVQQLAGPTFTGPVELLYEVIAFGNYEKLQEGDYSGFSSSAAKFVVNNMPMARMWWARAALERGLTDQIKRMADPQFDEKARKRMNKLRTEEGQQAWWKPGELLPEALQ